jgi:hypothetical protein
MGTKTLIERAEDDAKARKAEKRAEEKAKRDATRAEFAAVTSTAAEFVSRKLETEITPDQLRHQEQTWLDAGEELAWDLELEGLKFEISRKNDTDRFSLYLLDKDDPEAPGQYIRRLADLAEL